MSGFCLICPHHGEKGSCKFENTQCSSTDGLIVEHRTIPARQVISTITKKGQMAYIKSGWAYSFRIMPDGERHLGGLYTGGDMLCWPTFFNRDFDCNARAITQLSICLVDLETFTQRVREQDKFFDYFQKMMQRHIWHISTKAYDLACLSAEERLCRTFLWASISLYGEIRNYIEPIPVTQEILADLIGTSKIHVNRLLSKLRQDDVCHLSHGYLSILNWEKLICTANVSAAELEEWMKILAPLPDIPKLEQAKEQAVQ